MVLCPVLCFGDRYANGLALLHSFAKQGIGNLYCLVPRRLRKVPHRYRVAKQGPRHGRCLSGSDRLGPGSGLSLVTHAVNDMHAGRQHQAADEVHKQLIHGWMRIPVSRRSFHGPARFLRCVWAGLLAGRRPMTGRQLGQMSRRRHRPRRQQVARRNVDEKLSDDMVDQAVAEHGEHRRAGQAWAARERSSPLNSGQAMAGQISVWAWP